MRVDSRVPVAQFVIGEAGEPSSMLGFKASAARANEALATVVYQGDRDFNGDDAITLEYGGKVIDIVGKVGEKKVWKDSKGVKMTQNKTIRRKKAISAGNPVWDAAEWNAYSKNQLNGLGNHNFKA